MESFYAPYDLSLYTARGDQHSLLVLGPVLGTDAEQKLVLYCAGDDRLDITRWTRGKVFPTLDGIAATEWTESVNIEGIEGILERFEPAAADILAVVDHEGAQEQLGCTSSPVWRRWMSAGSPPSPSTADRAWYTRCMAKLAGPAAAGAPGSRRGGRRPGGAGVVMIGPGFAAPSALRALTPSEKMETLLRSCS